MVSRRMILSRSRDDLNLNTTYMQQQVEEEEDIWYSKEKLFKEHIQEVLDKWTQIDDEIWAKVIVFERNRRVAKAYARAPVLTVNGSDDGFDGMRIGLCGFDNPMRDPKTEMLKQHIGQGIKVKMDDAGNILVRRYSKSNVYVKSTANTPNEETAIGSDILKVPNHVIEHDKVTKIFDMKKFQSNVNRELSRAYPDRRRLETQCLSVLCFVKSENEILDCPIWILIVNVVAIDMLKSKLPLGKLAVQRPVDIKNRPRIPIPDEDPYSVASNELENSGASGSSGEIGRERIAVTKEHLMQQMNGKRSEKPPKLPPRDNIYPQPDYDDIEDRKISARRKSEKGKNNKSYDDPYYCGLRARVPNFVKKGRNGQQILDPNVNYISANNLSKMMKEKDNRRLTLSSNSAPFLGYHPSIGNMNHYNHSPYSHRLWQAKSYESGIDSEESPYQMYGRMPLPTRYIPQPKIYGVTTGEWD